VVEGPVLEHEHHDVVDSLEVLGGVASDGQERG
jgi:hypothetical protein